VGDSVSSPVLLHWQRLADGVEVEEVVPARNNWTSCPTLQQHLQRSSGRTSCLRETPASGSLFDGTPSYGHKRMSRRSGRSNMNILGPRSHDEEPHHVLYLNVHRCRPSSAATAACAPSSSSPSASSGEACSQGQGRAAVFAGRTPPATSRGGEAAREVKIHREGFSREGFSSVVCSASRC